MHEEPDLVERWRTHCNTRNCFRWYSRELYHKANPEVGISEMLVEYVCEVEKLWRWLDYSSWVQLSLIFSSSTKTCIPHTSPPQREDRGSGSQPPVGGISQSNVGPLCMLGRSIAAHAVFGETLANMYCISFEKINNSENEISLLSRILLLCCVAFSSL